ncbi:MAG: glycosyl transferase family 2, partial [Alphaproteobacteria bacterium]|nr:glycosyl transferase family 2 [Alphaproteobacteria bacterium]
VLSANWRKTVEIFAASPENHWKAGYFRLAFDDDTPALRRIAGSANWRSRVLGLPYGDQGLLIRRDFLAKLGGYRPIPLMEDVDLARRIGRHRLVALDAVATTSATRYRAGATQRVLRNLGCLALYFLGVPPTRFARLYR